MHVPPPERFVSSSTQLSVIVLRSNTASVAARVAAFLVDCHRYCGAVGVVAAVVCCLGKPDCFVPKGHGQQVVVMVMVVVGSRRRVKTAPLTDIRRLVWGPRLPLLGWHPPAPGMFGWLR